MADDLDSRLATVSALGEPVRRALYRYVAAQPDSVSRDEAAEGVGVARHTAKFHLDRLVADGLLEVEFRRPPGRTGPGAGRPTKRYRRAARELVVSLPERRYDLAGHILAAAVTRAERERVPVAEALQTAASDFGRSLAEEAERITPAEGNGKGDMAAVSEALAAIGYEPRSREGCLVLANCPFHALAQDYTDLVCGMNLDLLDSFLEALDLSELQAQLDPAPGRCCVTICQRD